MPEDKVSAEKKVKTPAKTTAAKPKAADTDKKKATTVATKKPAAAKAAAPSKAPQEKTPKAEAQPKKPAAEKKAAPVEKKPDTAAPAKVADTPKETTAGKVKSAKKLTITLTKSLSGRLEKHIATAKSLGLKKIGNVTTQPDNTQTRGKIAQISYMVTVAEE